MSQINNLNKSQIDIVKSIKNTLMEDFSNNVRNGLYALTQKMFAYNSNRIEGSTLSSEHTASLFDTGTLVSDGTIVYKAKDIEETTGHFKMFNEMLKNLDAPLTADLIKQFHYQLKSGVFEDYANNYAVGDYKKRANIISDITTTSPQDVEKEMEKLLDEYQNSDKTIKDIAVFHAKYEKIHPFQDGNGRTGRMIIFKQCLDNNYIPVIIKEEDKPLYISALHKAIVDKSFDDLINVFNVSQDKYLSNIRDFLDIDLQEVDGIEEDDNIEL